MQKLKVLLYVQEESCFSYLFPWMKNTITDFIFASADDKETFLTMILNGYPDLLIIEEQVNGENGLSLITNLRKENITTPFILLMEDFNETMIKKVVELGGLNAIVRSDDTSAIRHKLSFCKHSIAGLKKKDAGLYLKKPAPRLDELTYTLDRQEFMNKLCNGKAKSIILLNIDDFGLINQTYGLSIGDTLLKKAAYLIAKILPHDTSLFRISGDEFAVLIEGANRDREIQLVKKIQKLFSREQVYVENLEITISFTIGSARGNDPDLLRKADTALRRARAVGKNRYEEYSSDPALEEKQRDNLLWAQKISRAIEGNLFFPVFQPIVNNSKRKIEIYECLARMIDSDKVIAPIQFIEPARRAGLLPSITKMIIEKSFEAFATNNFAFSINVSELDLRNRMLVPYIGELLGRYPIRPERFIIEISEGIQSEEHQADIDQIYALKNLGLKIAFDDFGKGNSNFCRILDLMPDYIKIDGSFIRHLDHNGKSFKISNAINQFGKSIDTKVVAEYVHSKDILERVLKLKVQYSQGYYFGKPMKTITGKIETDKE